MELGVSYTKTSRKINLDGFKRVFDKKMSFILKGKSDTFRLSHLQRTNVLKPLTESEEIELNKESESEIQRL